MRGGLDSLLAELRPPPVPAGLAERIAAAARSTPQEPHGGRARRAAAWRDRRGRWRRSLVIGAGAIGLAVSSAVAATLAGVPLATRMEAVIAKLPLIGKEAAAPEPPAPRPRAVERTAAPAAPVMESAPKPGPDLVRMHEVRQLRRLAAVRQRVEARRAVGLPTPRADRIERRLERRIEGWRQATPEQRQRYLELWRQRREARRARIDARRGANVPSVNAPQVTERPAAAGQGAEGSVYGPLDPRALRAPGEDGQQHRLGGLLRAQRLERLRQQRLERQGAPTAVRPAPMTRSTPATRSAPPAVRREGLRSTTR